MDSRLERLLSGLEGIRKTPSGWSALCPAHDDRQNSLSIGVGDDERILLHCHAGCEKEQVLDKLGLRMADLFPGPSARRCLVVAEYEYVDENGDLLFQVCRKDPKGFFQRRPDGKGGWDPNLNGVRRVPYRLPQVVQAVASGVPIYVCEGEKDVHTLEALGLVATTNSGGAAKGNWKPEFGEHLAGGRVGILPDNDEAGRAHAQDIAASLHGKAASVRVVDLPGLPPKGDVTDWVANGGTAIALREIVERSPEWEPPQESVAGNSTTVEVFHRTDLGNAERLVARYGDELRYEAASGLWYHFNGVRWERDDALRVEALAARTARAIYEEVSREEDQCKRRDLDSHARVSESRPRQQAMIASARHMLAILPHEWDKDPWLLNVLNGTLDLRTGELRPHRREDFITKLVEVEYYPGADAPEFRAFLERVQPDPVMRAFLQRSLGYSLTGLVREQHFWFALGVGANGKGTLLGGVQNIMGDYATQAPCDLLIRDRGRHPTELAYLRGVRLVVASETQEGSRMDESKVKQLTGGDRITARYMGGDFFEYAPTHKLWLQANHKPRILGTDHAIWRRPLLIDFGVVIPESEQDKELAEKLREEAPGVLRWCVEGCLAWQQEGLCPPSQVLAATEGYRLEMDVVRKFLDNQCIVEPDATVWAAALYGSYCRWCESSGERPLNQREFGRSMTERGLTRRRSTASKTLYEGIKLRSEPSDLTLQVE